MNRKQCKYCSGKGKSKGVPCDPCDGFGFVSSFSKKARKKVKGGKSGGAVPMEWG